MRGANEYYNIFHNLNNTVMEDSGIITPVDDQYQYKHLVCVCSLYGTDPMFTIYAVMDTDILQDINDYDENKKQEVYGMIKGTDGWWNKCVWKHSGPWIQQFDELLSVINQQQSLYDKMKQEQQAIIDLAKEKKIEERLKLLSKVFEQDLPSTATLLDGTTFNGLLSKIQGSNKIIFSTIAINSEDIENAVVVSTDDSETKVYMYRDSNGTINIMPEKDSCEIYANQYCDNMFSGRNDIEQIILNNFNMENVISVKRMYYGCSSLQYIDTTKMIVDNVQYFDEMFGLSGLVSLDIKQWNTKNGVSFNGMMIDCSSLYTFEHNLDVSNAINISKMFYGCSNLVNISQLNFSFNNNNVDELDTSELFVNCETLLTIDLSKINGPIGKVFNWFNGCLSLQEIIGSENINLSICNDASNAFKNCSNLTLLNLSNTDCSKIKNFDNMFDGCSSLSKIGCNNWNLQSAQSSIYMFRDCEKLQEEITIVNTKMSNADDYTGMFINACTSENSLFKVNYTNSTNQGTAEGMVATKSESSNVELGIQIA